MTQERCPHCGKRRRKAEPSKTKPEKRWKHIDGVGLVCFMCAFALNKATEPPKT